MNIIKTINGNELKKLLNVTDGIFAQRDKVMLILLYNTGLRVSELCGLNIRDVMNGEVRHELKVHKEIAKGNRERIIPLNEKARTAIQDLINFNTSMGYDTSPKSPLLQGRKHGRLTRQQVHYIVYELGKRANL
jgi:site-specific recombinase XerD